MAEATARPACNRGARRLSDTRVELRAVRAGFPPGRGLHASPRAKGVVARPYDAVARQARACARPSACEAPSCDRRCAFAVRSERRAGSYGRAIRRISAQHAVARVGPAFTSPVTNRDRMVFRAVDAARVAGRSFMPHQPPTGADTRTTVGSCGQKERNRATAMEPAPRRRARNPGAMPALRFSRRFREETPVAARQPPAPSRA